MLIDFIARSITAILFSALFVLLAGISASAQSKTGPDAALKLYLFGDNVIEGYNGCHLAFWQANKNPGKDKYSYVFYAPFNDGEELPGWVKIGKDVFEFERQDKGDSRSRSLEALRLYRDPKGIYTMVVEVIKQRESGDDLVIDEARLIFTRHKHYPFIIRVKGALACPSATAEQSSAPADTRAGPDRVAETFSYNLEGDPITLGRGIEFSSLSAVPKGILRSVKRDAADCDPQSTPGYGARYAISGAMTLWQIPCNQYARTASSVFVTALNENPEYSTVLHVPIAPSGNQSGFNYEMPLPTVFAKSGGIESFSLNGDGSCGAFTRYQLRAVEGEAVEIFLAEYREKPRCDGVATRPENFPLKFSARK